MHEESWKKLGEMASMKGNMGKAKDGKIRDKY